MSKTKEKIVAWIPSVCAAVKYACSKPDNWDSMNGDQKLEYFEQHMKYDNDKQIKTDYDPDWYEAIDPNIDFDEE